MQKKGRGYNVTMAAKATILLASSMSTGARSYVCIHRAQVAKSVGDPSELKAHHVLLHSQPGRVVYTGGDSSIIQIHVF